MKNSNLLQLNSSSFMTYGFFLGFIALLIFFRSVDVYHQHFFDAGVLIFIYNIARVLYILYFGWLCYAAGDCTFRYILRNTDQPSFTLNDTLLKFFSGIGIWQIFLFGAGLAGLYRYYLMAGMSLLLLTLSMPRLNEWINNVRIQKKIFYWPGILFLVLPVILFLMTKGLYPAGGHDYYNHYFYFYRKVIDTGSIFPNEVWYHFYYSKGLGIYFLSMLLTDPLAPQLATTAMIFSGAAIIFSILRSSEWRLLPWIGAAFYIFFLTYTPGPLENMRHGGWGDLEKTHEPAAVLTLAIIWMTLQLVKDEKFHLYGIALLLAVCAQTLMSPLIAIYSGIYLVVLSFWLVVKKHKLAALWSMIGALSTFSCLLLLWIVNYLLTGMPDDQLIIHAWPLINFDKIKSWGIIFEVLLLHRDRVWHAANKMQLTMPYLMQIFGYLRFHLWGPFLAIILFSSLLNGRNIFRLNLKKEFLWTLKFVFAFLLLIIFLSLFLGREQSISYYRFTTFAYGPALVFCLVLLSILLEKKIKLASFCVMAGFIFGWINIHQLPLSHLKFVKLNWKNSSLRIILKNSERFFVGRFSIRDAYQNQQGWPGRMPWGGIYPPLEHVWRLLPPKTRIWSPHIHSYCMLPDCYMENFKNFRYSFHPESIYFEKETAKEILKKENLNYFFISNVLSIPQNDYLALFPLFPPEHIADYLGIVWTDGENTLLTWKEQASIQIDSVWLTQYQEKMKDTITSYNTAQVKFMASHVKSSYEEGNNVLRNIDWSEL